jgi:type III pantothenate kinase
MTLLIDIGNTRIKWSSVEGKDLAPMQAIASEDWRTRDAFRHILLSHGTAGRILVSNVAGEEIAKRLRDTAATLAFQCEFIESTSNAFGITNGYSNPQHLGIDRWLSMLAAWSNHHTALCVVSVGTALTIDAITADGQHLGGQIMPGPGLMQQSLLSNTSDIAHRSTVDADSKEFFANNTGTAVTRGIQNYIVSSVMMSMSKLTELTNQTPTLIITGGASRWLTDTLSISCITIPDLVLRGLALFATCEPDRHNSTNARS